ncbi:hypothetical protein CRENBAI_022204 [Crenichthys baileyi]|uniref:Ig-like domain-containing protein n=1 Tax=Crenichthys baileyi TaxID=28760 RepID=A0AAV9SD87_9TELE
MPGDDVVLPCQAEPPEDPSQITVEWGRPDLKPRFVHVWHNQKEYLADQNAAYRGRTSLFHNKLKDGDVSLKLANVRHSDNGRYRCYNPREKTENFAELLVGSVSQPGISLAGLDKSSGEVMLDCSSAGWYPEPELFWLDGEENIMSAGPPETTTDPDGVYSVSSRVMVGKRHNNHFTCRVQQKDINQTRETHIYVPDDFFIAQSDCSVSISFNVILVIMLVFGVLLLIWRNRNTKKKLADKVNEEQLKLMTEVKSSNLEEELKKSNQDQRSIDQQIEALMKMSEELNKQKKQLTDQTEEAEKMLEENEMKLKAVDDEVKNQTENKTERKAQGYLKLKRIIAENNEKLDKRKMGHQKVELITDDLMNRTFEEVKKLKERKQEIEIHIVDIQKQLN